MLVVTSMWRHRRLLMSLARHDLRRPYVGTAAGICWSVLSPIVPLLLYTVVFSLGLRLPLGSAPYVFGFAAAYVPWVLLSSAISGASTSIVEHRYLVKRVRFPIEIIPADPLLVHSLPHAILLAITVAAFALAGYVRIPQLFLIGYFYVCAAALAIGVGLLCAGCAVIARDVQQIVPSALNVWFWMTPVLWATTQLPPFGRHLLALNPASYVVSGYRYALMPTVFAPPALLDTVVFWTLTAALLVASAAGFARLRPHFWDCL